MAKSIHMQKTRPSAAVIIIGNEILTGRTHDTNLNHLACELFALGVDLTEARVIPDIEQIIVDTVRELHKKYDYVFTTGGIGPTHDDITSECIAKAFNVELVQEPEIVRRLKKYYENNEKKLNSARLRMANIPKGAKLIDNPLTSAPGFYIENVFVLAGFPSIMKIMFEGTKKLLDHGQPRTALTVTIDISEGEIAEELFELQDKYKDIEIGSYPFTQDGKFCTSLVMRGDDLKKLAELEEKIKKISLSKGANIIEN